MKHYLFLLAVCFHLTSFSQSENASRLRNFNQENGIAIRDFDPVNYFKGKAAKGTEKLQHTYKGITYYFINQENLDEFKKSPAKYEPAYGGWCAYTMAMDGTRARIDPSTFKIIDGKVYLFGNFNGKNFLLPWNKDEKKLKAKADHYWIKKMH